MCVIGPTTVLYGVSLRFLTSVEAFRVSKRTILFMDRELAHPVCCGLLLLGGVTLSVGSSPSMEGEYFNIIGHLSQCLSQNHEISNFKGPVCCQRTLVHRKCINIFPESYSGMCGQTAHIRVKEYAKPVFHKRRRVLCALRWAVEAEFKKNLED